MMHTRKVLIARILVGAVLVVVAASPLSRLVPRNTAALDSNFLFIDAIYRGYGVDFSANYRFEIRYPKVIQENSSDVVSVELWECSPGEGSPPESDTFSLFASAFVVTPPEPQTKPIDNDGGITEGTAPLAVWSWSISPAAGKFGEQLMILEWENDRYFELLSPDSFLRGGGQIRSQINGIDVDLKSSLLTKRIELPVSVVTSFGISRRTLMIAKASIALFGFVLMYPVLTALLKKRFGLTGDE